VGGYREAVAEVSPGLPRSGYPGNGGGFKLLWNPGNRSQAESVFLTKVIWT